MKVKIVNKSKHPLPEYATPMSAGMDLRDLSEPIELKPLGKENNSYRFVLLELPKGYSRFSILATGVRSSTPYHIVF